MHSRSSTPQGPSPAMRRSLTMGAACSAAGLLAGAWLVATAQDTKGYLGFVVAAPLAAFLTGLVLWRLLVAGRHAPGRGAAVFAGVTTGILSHWLCWYFVIVIQNLRHVLLGEVSSLGEPPVNLLDGLWAAGAFSFWSLIVIGWATAPLGGLIGFIVHDLQFRRRRHTRPPEA